MCCLLLPNFKTITAILAAKAARPIPSLPTMVLNKRELKGKPNGEHELSKGDLRDENELDLSDDFSKFLEACRSGDLMQCQMYITAGVNVNGKDKFDYTPLILVSMRRASERRAYLYIHDIV